MNDNKNPINVILLSLNSSFCKDVAAELASELGMFFSDCKDLVEYELLDSKAIMENCGLDYLKKREAQALKHTLIFENSVFSCDFDLFKNNKKLFTKKSLLCYLQLPEKCFNKDAINNLAFDSRNDFLLKNSNITIPLKSLSVNMAVKNIIKSMRELL